MGLTKQLPERERYVYEREYMLDRITVMMGGRAAEELVFGTFTSGAQDDLFQAVALVRRMVLEWGMSDALGPVVAERPHVDLLHEQLGQVDDADGHAQDRPRQELAQLFA